MMHKVHAINSWSNLRADSCWEFNVVQSSMWQGDFKKSGSWKRFFTMSLVQQFVCLWVWGFHRDI